MAIVKEDFEKGEDVLNCDLETVKKFFDNSETSIVVTDPNQPDNPVVFVNRTFERLTGYSKEEVLGQNCRFMNNSLKTQAQLDEIRGAIKEQRSVTVDIMNLRKNGQLFYNRLRISPVFEEGTLKYFIGEQNDITHEKLLERENKKSFQKYYTLLNNLNDLVWEVDKNGYYTYISDHSKDLLGFTPEEMIGKTPFDFMPESMVEEAKKEFFRYVESKEPFRNIEQCNFTKSGELLYLEKNGQPILDQDDTLRGYIGFAKDITKKKMAVDELKDKHNLLETVVQERTEWLRSSLAELQSYKRAMDANSIVSKADRRGIITYANEKFSEVSGYSKKELIGKPHSIVRHPDTPSELFKELWETIQAKKIWNGILQNRCKNGESYYVDISILPILDQNNEIVEYIAVRHDITELILNKKAFEKRVITDSLTGLGNRFKLLEDIKNKSYSAMLLIDIDGFNEINDFYGYEFGDKVILAFGKLLKNDLSQICQIYRLHGDQFALLGCNVEKSDFVKHVQSFCSKVNQQEVIIDETEISLQTTASISFESSSLIASCDMARRYAKQHAQHLIIYSEGLGVEAEIKNNISWTLKLKKAFSEDRIDVYFQPIWNNQTKKIEKYESLVRLIDEKGEIISPYFFLKVAKKSKQYSELSQTVIRKVSEYAVDLEGADVSINLTKDDILDQHIMPCINQNLKSTVKNKIVIELVESEGIDNFAEVTEFIEKAKSKGCQIAIDDFGTGYSNFEYLLRLKADIIKIDGSLIKDIHLNKAQENIVRLIIEFAQKQNMKTIAEFVSSKEIYDKVVELGIDYSQGYYIGKPMSIHEIRKLRNV